MDTGVEYTDGGRVRAGRLRASRHLIYPVRLIDGGFQRDDLCQLVRSPQFGEIV
ncbi:hypothetical protein M3G91_21000 [Micromonospora chalcea]|uniref:hypothetical protein n=1 Tax=Micromonospora chalcea TaxID=1874 RepID=UPI0021A7438A|nr:hypothetical protein [Micromonospora chalcea]MCT2280095.1 hypothetical protein [Micromonospora chalcea]